MPLLYHGALADAVLLVEWTVLLGAAWCVNVPLFAAALLALALTTWWSTGDTDFFMLVAGVLVVVHFFTSHHYLATVYVACIIFTRETLIDCCLLAMFIADTIFASHARAIELGVRLCLALYVLFVACPVGGRWVFASLAAQDLVTSVFLNDVRKCVAVSLVIASDAVLRGLCLTRVATYACVSLGVCWCAVWVRS